MTVALIARRLAVGALVSMLPATVAAQSTGQTTQAPRLAPAPRVAGDPLWEIDAHGGLSSIFAGTGGTAALPAPGSPIVTSSPVFPGRTTASWFFGDGAGMLNDANGQLGAGAITPLDSVLKSLGLSSAPGATLGVRVRRVMTRRLSWEVSVDRLMGSRHLTDALKAGIEASRSTFESAFTGLFGSGPFTATTVQATSLATAGRNGEMAVTGGLNLKLQDAEMFVPYLTVGGGFVKPTGQLPSAHLEGNYQTTLPGGEPLNETDSVTIRYSTRARLVGVLGGGVRRDMSARWGYRVDARVFLSGGTDALLLDASPSAKPGTPAGYIETLTYPNLQFSNNSSTARSSTLSGVPLDGFTAFTRRVEARVLITAGIFVRF